MNQENKLALQLDDVRSMHTVRSNATNRTKYTTKSKFLQKQKLIMGNSLAPVGMKKEQEKETGLH